MSSTTERESTDESGGTAWRPDLIYTDGQFVRDHALVCDENGRIIRISTELKNHARIVRLRHRALLPGLVNAHSHAFQRVIRGRTECRSAANLNDSFWTWREMMYHAAERLTPEGIYDAARMAFLEMLASGITAVGEFHYLHHTPQGTRYDNPNLLAEHVIEAARSVGICIALLRVAYARSGYGIPPNERQARFIEPDAQTFLCHIEDLQKSLARDDARDRAWVGVAPHSVRAVPLAYIREVSAFAAQQNLPVHMHVAEQPAEVEACVREHGRTPVALLADEGLLDSRFTGVHAIHITPDEVRALGAARASVCACPTTERNLGDGIIPADALFRENVPVALGSDSHTQIDLLEDARELEYHLRLQKLERAVLAPDTKDAGPGGNTSALAARLFECATVHGARSIGSPGSEGASLTAGRPADFFTVDLDDPSIAGASDTDLLSAILFSLSRTAIREVVVGGQLVIEGGRHRAQEEIVGRFAALQQRLWS